MPNARADFRNPALQRKTPYRACRRKADCVRGTAKGDTRVGSEFYCRKTFTIRPGARASRSRDDQGCPDGGAIKKTRETRQRKTEKGKLAPAKRAIKTKVVEGETQIREANRVAVR
jgi:hypothetical protein